MSELPPDLPERKTSTPQENQNLQDPNPNAENPSEFKRFIKHARQEAKRGGDVNVAHVGQAAQVDQLAVGRNILQAKINIGTLVIPVRFLLVLLVVALVVVVAVWWIATPGQMPPGGATATASLSAEAAALSSSNCDCVPGESPASEKRCESISSGCRP